MGPKASSGFYLSRTSAALLALLLAALLLALIVLGALYARTTRAELIDTDIDTLNLTTPTLTCTLPPQATGRPGIWDNPRLPPDLVPMHYDLELWPRTEQDAEGNYLLSGQVNITISCVHGTDVVLLHSSELNISRAQLAPLAVELHYKSKQTDSKQSQVGLKLTNGASFYEEEVSSHLQDTSASSSDKNISITNLWYSEPHQYLVLELERPLVAGNLYVLELDYQGFLSSDYSGLFIASYKDFNVEKVLVASELEPTSARTVYPCFDEPALKATFKTRIVHNSSYVALSNMPAIATSEREDVDGNKWTVTTFNTTLKMSTYITAFVVCDFDYVRTTERGNEIRVWARKEVIKNGFANFALDIAGPIFSYLEDLLNWFGNLVTMKWWNDIWLNEGFASYYEYIGASFIEPKLTMNELFMMNNLISIFESDTQATARPVSVKEEAINNVNLIEPLFDEFTYSKAAALIRMASTFLTETLFLKGISSYLKKFSFSNADQDGLWNHLQMFIDDQDEVKLPMPLKNIMDSWTWNKGIPLVTLNTSTGTLSQGVLKLANNENVTSDSNHTWIIPIFWVKNGAEQPLIWLDTQSSNRAQMMDDAFILANAGYMEYETTLNLTRYLEKEMEILVWYRVLKHLNNDKKSMLTYHSFPLMKKYILKRINPIFQHYATIIRRNFEETADDIFVHTGINDIFKTACFLGLKDCLALASELYTKWMANTSTNDIPQSIRGSVYCYGIAEGGEKEWEFAWSYHNKSDSEGHWEQSYLKQGLSCTKEPWLLYRYLKESMNTDSHNLLDVFSHMFKNDIGRHVAWDFLKENWHQLNDINMKDSSHFYELLLPDLGSKATSELQFQELELFTTTTMDEGSRDKGLKWLQAKKKARLEWIHILNTRIIDWLQRNTPDSDF
ncbi:hypothetical protein GDO78_007621 [Eleutherodactylus coqui]|uniref:Aminopeptidase n=1 Tax=Eleutherodactylus coqui TaxID=57060 RepID=A0A8J6FJS1_ELECQ|nr:hypothetical protein GDO78_007621 [Eleutherodactylus coqui]